MTTPPRRNVSHPGRAETRSHLTTTLLVVLTASLLVLGMLRGGDTLARDAVNLAEAAGRNLTGMLLGEVRVGIQIGHLNAGAHPAEHARLRVSTGGTANGVDEVDVNLAVAEALRDILSAEGIEVDLLPASVPPRYRADAVVSLHADSIPDSTRRGYKSSHFDPPRTPQERSLKRLLDQSYLAATGLPDDDANVSGNMLRYYAFDPTYHHAVSPVTPSVLVEMGYISNVEDLELLTDPAVPARAIAAGLVAYLQTTGRLPDP
jgi:N-acetylmuramoyl-L-alanine amidase